MTEIKKSPKQSQQMFQAMFRKPVVRVPAGKVRGTGKRLTDEREQELLALRRKDPQTYTFRRLALIFGITDSAAHYLVAKAA